MPICIIIDIVIIVPPSLTIIDIIIVTLQLCPRPQYSVCAVGRRGGGTDIRVSQQRAGTVVSTTAILLWRTKINITLCLPHLSSPPLSPFRLPGNQHIHTRMTVYLVSSLLWSLPRTWWSMSSRWGWPTWVLSALPPPPFNCTHSTLTWQPEPHEVYLVKCLYPAL